jgi:hypothetical protein
MTMDLIAEHGEQHFNNNAWNQLLQMALQHGWQPAGVLKSERPDAEDEDGPEGEVEEEGWEEDEPDEEAEGEEEPEGLGEEAEGVEIPEDHPLARVIRSLFPRSGDPVVGGYFVNDGQRVTAEDARALADALERALPDIPDHDAMAHKTFEHPSEPGVRLVAIDTPASPYEWFSGDKKRLVRQFIDFCRQGGFEIW